MALSPEKELTFYAGLGHAVASWQSVEMRLGLLFSLALQGKGQYGASRL
jgi:hypothetical protein